MTFKWTYLLVAIVVVAAIVASGVAGGFAGGFSYAQGIGAILVGGLVIYFAGRTGRREMREQTEVNATAVPFTGYPKDQALAIFDRENDALGATRELHASGYGSVQRFAGMDGAARLDSEGSAHGGAAAVERAIEQVASDVSKLEEYDAAVREGSIVLGVRVPDGEPPHRAARIIERHHGHDVRYFSGMTVERLDVDPQPTRAD